jgi:PAS domain-containing protein
LLGVGVPEDLMGQNLLEIVHPDDREKIRARSISLVENKVSLEPMEHKLLTQDGRVVVVESRVNFIEFNGEPAGLAIIRDLTGRRQTEEALKRSQESFQSVIKILNDGFALFDAKYQLVYANDEYKKLHEHIADILEPGLSAEN